MTLVPSKANMANILFYSIDLVCTASKIVSLKCFLLVHDEALLRFKQDPSNLEKCAVGPDQVKFWLSHPNITKDSDVSNFECKYVFGDRIESWACLDRFPCGICKLPAAKKLLIKGVCAPDVEMGFDFDFGIYGTLNQKPLFR